jgi:curved DNA-binding protein CbpA
MFKQKVKGKYTLVVAMTVPEALKLLGLEASDLADKDKVKKIYRQKAMDVHPDRGGSEEQMKKVNQAYDVLSKPGITFSDPRDREAEREEQARKYQAAGEMVQATLDKNLDVEAFKSHLSTVTGKKYKAEVKKQVPEDWKYAYYLSYFVKLVSEDGLTAFDFSVSVNLTDVVYGKATLSGGDATKHISFPLSISVTVFHNNRKVKLSQRGWTFTSDHKTLVDPEELFPTAKLKKMMSPSSKDKSRKFQKRDMYLSLQKRLNAVVWSDPTNVAVPVGDVWMLLYRTTWNKQAVWMINGLYANSRGGKRLHMLPTVTWAEEESTIEKLVALQKKAESLKGDAVMEMLKSELKS